MNETPAPDGPATDTTGTGQDAPGVVAFPPLLAGGTLVIGLVIHLLTPISPFPVWPSRIAGAILFVGSFLLARWGRRTMQRAGTNIRPDQPTLAIVTDGPFRFTRNPLYVALIGVYLGVTLLVDALAPLVLLVPMVAVLHWGVVRREERYLEKKFGLEYRAYKERVRRWI